MSTSGSSKWRGACSTGSRLTRRMKFFRSGRRKAAVQKPAKGTHRQRSIGRRGPGRPLHQARPRRGGSYDATHRRIPLETSALDQWSARPLVAFPAMVVQGMVFGPGVGFSPAVAAQAGLRIVGFQVVRIGGDFRSLVGDREEHQPPHERQHQGQDQHHTPIQKRFTGARDDASPRSCGWRPAPWPAPGPAEMNPRRWRPPRPGCLPVSSLPDGARTSGRQ